MKKSLYISLNNKCPRVIGIAKIIIFDKNGARHETYGRIGQRIDNDRVSRPKYIYSDWEDAQDELDRYADDRSIRWLGENKKIPNVVFDEYTCDIRGRLFAGKVKQIGDEIWRRRWRLQQRK